MINISTVINYCSNDFDFLDINLSLVSQYSNDIIISVGDKFFNGEPENESIIKKSKNIVSNYPNARLIQYQSCLNTDNTLKHDLNARIAGLKHIKNIYCLLLDIDELTDVTLIKKFLSQNELIDQYDAIHFESFWYYRDPTMQSTTKENCGLIINTSKINIENYSHLNHDRYFVHYIPTIKLFNNANYNNIPIFHHYSWVKPSKEALINKVRFFSHRADRDWISLINQNLQQPFTENDSDPVHNRKYIKVPNFFNIPFSL